MPSFWLSGRKSRQLRNWHALPPQTLKRWYIRCMEGSDPSLNYLTQTNMNKTTLLVGDKQSTDRDHVAILVKSNRKCNIAAALTYGFIDTPDSIAEGKAKAGDPVYLLDLRTDKTYYAGILTNISRDGEDLEADWALNNEGKTNSYKTRLCFASCRELRDITNDNMDIKFNTSHRSTRTVMYLYLQ